MTHAHTRIVIVIPVNIETDLVASRSIRSLRIMLKKLSQKIQQSVENATKPAELHSFDPPIGLDPRRANTVSCTYMMHKSAQSLSGLTEYVVKNAYGQDIIKAKGNDASSNYGQCALERLGELNVTVVDIVETSGTRLFSLKVSSMTDNIACFDPDGRELFEIKDQMSGEQNMAPTIWHSLIQPFTHVCPAETSSVEEHVQV